MRLHGAYYLGDFLVQKVEAFANRLIDATKSNRVEIRPVTGHMGSKCRLLHEGVVEAARQGVGWLEQDVIDSFGIKAYPLVHK